VFGSVCSSTFNSVYNFGILSSSSEMIVCGNSNVGGISGQLEADNCLNNVGVYQGLISGSSDIGALFGMFKVKSSLGSIETLYAKDRVTVSASSQGGGLIGKLQFDASNLKFCLSGSYSRATVNAQAISGGLFGEIYFNHASTEVFISDTYFSGSISVGADLIGSVVVAGGVTGYQLCFKNAYYENDTNSLPAITSPTYITNGAPIGLNCSNPFYAVSGDTNYFSGLNLLNEFGSVYLGCSCCA